MSEPKFTVALICSSIGDSDELQVEVKWSPEIDGEDVGELGYLPASYSFVQNYILPALEQAFLEGLDAPETTRH